MHTLAWVGLGSDSIFDGQCQGLNTITILEGVVHLELKCHVWHQRCFKLFPGASGIFDNLLWYFHAIQKQFRILE